jgi:hypothetical protein
MKVFFLSGDIDVMSWGGPRTEQGVSHDLEPVHKTDMGHLKLGNLLLSTGLGT